MMRTDALSFEYAASNSTLPAHLRDIVFNSIGDRHIHGFLLKRKDPDDPWKQSAQFVKLTSQDFRVPTPKQLLDETQLAKVT